MKAKIMVERMDSSEIQVSPDFVGQEVSPCLSSG